MERNTVSLFETIQTLLDNKRYSTLRDILNTMNPVDIAALSRWTKRPSSC